MVQCEDPAGLARYIGYFSLVAIAALAVAAITLKPSGSNTGTAAARGGGMVYGLLSLLAFCATWWHLGAFLVEDYSRFSSGFAAGGTTPLQYLCSRAPPGHPDLFSEAYRQVSLSASGWWWSARLLRGAFASAALMCAAAAAARLPPAHTAAFLLLDFGVANSVALCLLLSATEAQLLSTVPFSPVLSSAGAPALGFGGWARAAAAVACYLASGVAAAALSSDGSASFKLEFVPALAVMHAGMLLPAVAAPMRVTAAGAGSAEQRRQLLSAAVVWAALAVGGAVGLWRETAALPLVQCARRAAGKGGWAACVVAHVGAGWTSSCQSSISWDYVFTLAAAAAFITRTELHSGRSMAAAVAAAAPLALTDVATALPAYMALRAVAAARSLRSGGGGDKRE